MEKVYFRDIDKMPDKPALPVPDYAALNTGFHRALMDPANKILRYSENGHPIFAAYIESTSNEMVTWGILALGEWLMNRDTEWIKGTYEDFFSQAHGLYLNAPGSQSSEHWYLFYVNMLAGALTRTLFKDDEKARLRMGSAADAMHEMAQRLQYDFNQQGYRFNEGRAFTNRDEYRQPDSIAGFAYQMLFAALQADRPMYLKESVEAVQRYLSFSHNPWYEIPNGSAGLMACAWLNAHGYRCDVYKAAFWVFDHEEGPLQIGRWGGEEVNGLMMGWRGETRQEAMNTAYSMETLMPLQFILPSVRYYPAMADAVGKYVRCVLSAFPLFYGQGLKKLHETRPDLDANIPYERLDAVRGGHSPCACGDFHGHRSVYGAGYLEWMEAMVRPTSDGEVFALDLALTDWLADEKYPVFLLRNHSQTAKKVSFTPADIWKQLRPELYTDERLSCTLCDLATLDTSPCDQSAEVLIAPGECVFAALIKNGETVAREDGFVRCGGAELLCL